VPDLASSMSFWRDVLGLALVKTAIVQDQGVKAALLRAGESEIELLEPLVAENGVGKFLARRGGGLHHVCFETEDVAGELSRARDKGIQLIDQRPRPGLAGLICFLHPKATTVRTVAFARRTAIH
jgi:methylmalonyl-CoA/ethylmalonyl-CoA epimerase